MHNVQSDELVTVLRVLDKHNIRCREDLDDAALVRAGTCVRDSPPPPSAAPPPAVLLTPPTHPPLSPRADCGAVPLAPLFSAGV